MEAVAARAGVSKMTVYSHFHDKETLFEMIVAATSGEMISALSTPDGGGTLEQRLNAIGVALLDVVLGSEFCTLAHTLPSTLRANQALAKRFYAAGPGRVRAALAAVIKEAACKGDLSVDDADHAAEDLISLWEGHLPARISFGLAEVLSRAEVERRTLRGTAVFLRAYRVEAGRRPRG
jgi:TetR/AcrR family transcriptional repressor of mexJK operon